MFSRRLLCSLLLSLCICFAVLDPVYSGKAPFAPCNELDKPIKSKDIKIDVSDCESTDRCYLKIGNTYNFTVNFVPETNLDKGHGIERYILAKFPAVEGDKPIEIPYGPAEMANENTFRADDQMSVSKSGNKIASGVNYLHNSLFPIPTTAPKTNVTVRFLLRERIVGLGRRRLTWKTHPGQLLACLEIPVELV